MQENVEPCPACNGEGGLVRGDRSFPGQQFPYFVCERCNGTGEYRPAPPPIEMRVGEGVLVVRPMPAWFWSSL